MVKAGHVRLGVALIAAIVLHALLLLWPDHAKRMMVVNLGSDALQIALLPDQKKLRAPEIKQVPEPLPMPAVRTVKRAINRHAQVTIRSKSGVPHQKTMKPENVKPAPAGTQQKAAIEMSLVPSDVQRIILANISYPRQARRHGQEGKAEFRFNINRQMVQHVTMLASTGHPILDRAARHGLISMHSLPLKDGDYRLPVVFRLQ